MKYPQPSIKKLTFFKYCCKENKSVPGPPCSPGDASPQTLPEHIMVLHLPDHTPSVIP